MISNIVQERERRAEKGTLGTDGANALDEQETTDRKGERACVRLLV